MFLNLPGSSPFGGFDGPALFLRHGSDDLPFSDFFSAFNGLGLLDSWNPDRSLSCLSFFDKGLQTKGLVFPFVWRCAWEFSLW